MTARFERELIIAGEHLGAGSGGRKFSTNIGSKLIRPYNGWVYVYIPGLPENFRSKTIILSKYSSGSCYNNGRILANERKLLSTT